MWRKLCRSVLLVRDSKFYNTASGATSDIEMICWDQRQGEKERG